MRERLPHSEESKKFAATRNQAYAGARLRTGFIQIVEIVAKAKQVCDFVRGSRDKAGIPSQAKELESMARVAEIVNMKDEWNTSRNIFNHDLDNIFSLDFRLLNTGPFLQK